MLRASCKVLLRIFGVAVLLTVALGVAAHWYMRDRESDTIELLAPSEGRLVKAGDATFFLQEAGPDSGPPVVLLAGAGMWSELWRSTIGELATHGYHVIAVDLPPFGFSERLHGATRYNSEAQAARLNALLDVLRLSAVTLIGHSADARHALEVALRAPARVARLVLVAPLFRVDTAGASEPSIMVRSFFAFPLVRDALLGAYATNPYFTERLLSSVVANEDAVSEDRVKVLQQPLGISQTTAATGDWLQAIVTPAAAAANNAPKLKALDMPVLIVWGRDDTVTAPQQGDVLQQFLGRGERAVIDRAGHLPFIENSRAFNGVLTDFLRRSAAPRAR